MVEGLKPEKDKHEFYFVLEPVCHFSYTKYVNSLHFMLIFKSSDSSCNNYYSLMFKLNVYFQKSSVVLDVAARMQLNMLLQPIDSIL